MNEFTSTFSKITNSVIDADKTIFNLVSFTNELQTNISAFKLNIPNNKV